jgi:hypothetical protein
VAQSGIDDDGIHEIFLLASFGVGYTLTILEIKREDLSEMTVSELGRRLVEAASKGKK